MSKVGERILKKFFYNYLILNDISQLEDLFSEKFKSVGTSQFEVARNKNEFLESMRNQTKNLKGRISFYLNDYVEDYLENTISSYCEVTFIYFREKERRITTRLTTVFFNENGMWKIINMHNSIAEITQKKDEILPIEWILKIEKNKEINISLPGKSKKGFFNIKDIDYINYSSTTRKTIFHLNNLEEFELKRNFSEVEEKLKDMKYFYKIDRGTIINLEAIKILDFKEEYILFRNEQALYISKIKLKELENKWNEIQSKKNIEF
jgi:DNA-binding LytR/AlgR family response regulator